MPRTRWTAEEIASWPVGHKKCKLCQEVLPFKDFGKHKNCLFGLDNRCKKCREPISKLQYKNVTFESTMFKSARDRAARFGREFSITKDDIVIPEHCPIFKVPLILERNHPYAPSLDRLNPNLGYTPENIIVMSRRANMLKNNMTPYEAKMMFEWLYENANYQQVMGLERVSGSVTYTRPSGNVDVTIICAEL